MRVYVDNDQLAATLTTSAFTLIGPAAYYAGSMLRLNLCVETMCWEDVQINLC